MCSLKQLIKIYPNPIQKLFGFSQIARGSGTPLPLTFAINVSDNTLSFLCLLVLALKCDESSRTPRTLVAVPALKNG